MAGILGEDAQRERITTLCADFQRHAVCLAGCWSSGNTGWTFVPGSVEFADFDPSATSIAITVADELPHLPRPAVEQTYDKYLEGFRKRRERRRALGQLQRLRDSHHRRAGPTRQARGRA